MAQEVHTMETDERQAVVGQERPPVEEPPAPVSGVKEARQDVMSSYVPSVAAPTPPSGRLAARIQRMPPAGRWTLGLALAFLSGFPFVLLGDITPDWGPAIRAIAIFMTFGLALAAGYVLSSWWALLALVGASAAGGLVGSWVIMQMFFPAGEFFGVHGIASVLVGFAFFAILELGSLIVLLLAGVCFGKLQGIALGQPHALSAGHARVIRWIAALGPVVAAGYFVTPFNLYGIDVTPVLIILPIFLYTTVLTATCLLAGWLLHSWWGLVVVPVVYVGVAIMKQAFLGGGVSDWPTAIVTFVLITVLPAVVMSAIGTAIGKYRAR